MKGTKGFPRALAEEIGDVVWLELHRQNARFLTRESKQNRVVELARQAQPKDAA